MARYTGSRDKINRRFGQPIFGPSKALERRNFPLESTVQKVVASSLTSRLQLGKSRK